MLNFSSRDFNTIIKSVKIRNIVYIINTVFSCSDLDLKRDEDTFKCFEDRYRCIPTAHNAITVLNVTISGEWAEKKKGKKAHAMQFNEARMEEGL